MDVKSKLIGAGCVLAVGLLMAMCFRHEQSAGEVGVDRPDRLVITSAPEPQPPLQLTPVSRSRRPTMNQPLPASPGLPGQSDVASKAFDSVELPPDLAPEFPGHTTLFGGSVGQPRAGLLFGPFAVRMHKVVDGDTLEALAERYLGCADRAGEIYQLNRDRLLSPELLPIGVELRIPVAATQSSGSGLSPPCVAKSPSNLMPQLPATPVEQ